MFNSHFDIIEKDTQLYATTTAYDILDRPTSITMPNNTVTGIAYGFGTDDFGDTRFLSEITDANNVTTRKYTDHRQLQTTIEAPNSTITSFVYDPLGQLTQSTDPMGNSTSYHYNKFGQLVQRNHPDAGATVLTYGPSGNLLSKQTQVLRDLSLAIHYTYDHGRPTHIAYPQHPENNVTYHYGPANSGNETGRITHIQDASGLQELKYGPLGELIENTRTFVHPGNGTLYTFRTQWEYDSWNRTRSITYADGEVVEYQYDNGGMLRHMSGTKGNDHYPYVDEIRYDKFGSRTHIAYGNGSYTHYTYEPDMRRLSRLETWDAGQNLMQDLAYTYDNTNNITELSNSAADVNGMGGVYQYYFAYDDLYRLSTAYGEFDGKMFNLAMQYSPNGQILEKELMADFSIAGNQYSTQYHNAYNYTAGRNAPQEVVDQFTNYHTSLKWDSNGNLVHHDESELSRNLCWDEENRLTTVKDGDYMSTYLYDHAGERVWKMSGEVQSMAINGQYYIDQVALDRKTLYTNPYLIVTEAEYTKHYYAESQRIASKLGGGWAQAGYDPLLDHLPDTLGFEHQILNGLLIDRLLDNAKCVGVHDAKYYDAFEAVYNQLSAHDPEINQYFYHPDHLGSSSFITNAGGDVDQHLQYLPFGEPWIDQRTQNNIRFTFSGKERDEETGYNYFGARYYNSDVSIWLSVDPLSDQYPSHSGYNYVMNNPIKLVDPNGMWVEGAGLLNNFFKSDERNKAEMKAKQLSAEGASNISVDRIDGGWRTSYTTQNNEGIDGADYALNEHGFIDFDKSRRGSSHITGILSAAGTTASYFEAVFKNDAKFKFKYNQRIDGIKKLATEITAENKASSIRTAKGLFRTGTALTFLSAFATAVDGINSGWENHHTADIVITGAIYGTALAFPGAGWIVGGAYFLIDMGFQEYTGKSLTQNLFDK